MQQNFLNFANRSSYNQSLKHFRNVTAIVKNLSKSANFADEINKVNETDGLSYFQSLSIVNVLLADKFELPSVAVNIYSPVKDIRAVVERLQKWNKFEVILVYHHPQLGVVVLSNHSNQNWESIYDIAVGDYLVCYIRAMHSTYESIAGGVADNIRLLFKDSSKINDSDFIDVKGAAKSSSHDDEAVQPTVLLESAPSQKATTSSEGDHDPPPKKKSENEIEAELLARLKSGKVKMSPKYSCQVTNELFHNGNVEAWKNIIESYNKAFPNVKVIVFHNGEKINNINTLFKWGKVKSGDVILFSLIGESFQSISKLQRYLFEGASNRFNKFLKKDLNKTLDLF